MSPQQYFCEHDRTVGKLIVRTPTSQDPAVPSSAIDLAEKKGT
jgi:hypothetical protein